MYMVVRQNDNCSVKRILCKAYKDAFNGTDTPRYEAILESFSDIVMFSNECCFTFENLDLSRFEAVEMLDVFLDFYKIPHIRSFSGITISNDAQNNILGGMII